MSTILELKGFDDLFETTLNEKYIVNNYDGTNKDVKKMIDDLVMRNHLGDNLSLIPSCSGGHLSGACYIGDVCSICNTPVTSPIDEELTFLVWLKQPKGVAPLILPIVLTMLMDRYKISAPNVNLIQYIMQANLVPKARNMKNMYKLEKLDILLAKEGITRGYNSFVNNFMRIVEILEMNFASGSKKNKEAFLNFMRLNHKNFFSSFVPIPNRSLFVFDTNETGSYIDKDMLAAVGAVRRFTGIDLLDGSVTQKQNKTAKSLIDLSNFYKDYIKESFFGKQGLIRKHISRTRSHYTMRAVVTSIIDIHALDEIHLPWTASCSLFREQIINALTSQGMSYREAVDYFMRHLTKYSPIIDDIFKRMIAESGEGIVGLFVRNPSLHRGSIQRTRVTKIKTSIQDNTISVSYLLSPMFNMDFDGDMMCFTPLFTHEAIVESENFRAHHNLLGLSGPNEFSGACGLPKTLISSLSNWYHSNPMHTKLVDYED